MKLTALVEGPSHVCCRYRIEAFAWALAERGMQLEVVPLKRRPAARVRQLWATRGADAVILQRKLLPIWQLALLRRSARRLIYDFDDAMFQRDSYSRKEPCSRTRLARFWATVYAADTILAGNDFLKQQASRYAEPTSVHRIPTCVEPNWYRPAWHARVGSEARLVWIGQAATLPSLACAREHLTAAGRTLPGMPLRLICDGTLDLSPLRVIPRVWSSQTETAELADADIGISWLPDDSWSRGKCGLKVLQYMAAGLPVVANPVGMNREMVLHERTGLLASTPREWADAIRRLADDPDLRRRMGAAGRRVAEQQYSVEGWGPKLAELVYATATGASIRHGRDTADFELGLSDEESRTGENEPAMR